MLRGIGAVSAARFCVYFCPALQAGVLSNPPARVCLCARHGSLRMPAVRAQEPPDAFAATVLWPARAVAFNGLGLVFANRSTVTDDN